MRISVDPKLCEAHAMCWMVDDQLFTLDEQGFSDLGEEGKPVPAGDEGIATDGVVSCPVRALQLHED